MPACTQSQQRQAMVNLRGGHLLCVNCYAILQQANTAAQQAQNQRMAELSAERNYLQEMMSWQMGLRNSPPQRQIPQPLRHTFATRQVQSGADLPTLAAMMGHANIKETMRYVHPNDIHKSAAMGRMDEMRIQWEKTQKAA